MMTTFACPSGMRLSSPDVYRATTYRIERQSKGSKRAKSVSHDVFDAESGGVLAGLNTHPAVRRGCSLIPVADARLSWSTIGSFLARACGCPDHLRRERGFDQLHPIGSPEGDHLVVEVVGGVMQPGAVAVAGEDKGAGARFQHEGEVFGAHDGCDVLVDALAARDLRRHRSRKGGLALVIGRDRIVATIVELGSRALECRGSGHHLLEPCFELVAHLRPERPRGAAQLRGLW